MVDIFENAQQVQMNEEKKQKTYIEEYDEFMSNFQLKEVSGEEVGEMIARMAGHFMRYNLLMIRSLKMYAKIKANLQSQLDSSTGKPMSSSKAEMMAASTPEAAAYEEARAHVVNIEQIINSFKSLQKGILQEYLHS